MNTQALHVSQKVLKKSSLSSLISLLFYLLLSVNFLHADSSGNGSCSNVETISELNNIVTGTTHTETGSVNYSSDRNDFYKYTVAVSGTISIDHSSSRYNQLWIGTTCSGYTVGNTFYVGAGNWNHVTTFNVSAGTTIYTRIRRPPYYRTASYSHKVTFTPSTPSLKIYDFSAKEGNIGTKDINITVKLTPPSASDVTVNYVTSNGTAIAGNDYIDNNGTLTFNAGESTQNISISVNGDTINEGDENFYITLSSASGGIPIADNKATITIENDDTPPVNNGYRDFTLRKQLYVKGNMKSIGNTVLVPPNPNNSANCSTYTNGTFDPDASSSNSNLTLCGYKVDINTKNSTTAQLDIPADSKIKWAGLYWQALVDDNDFSTTMPLKIKYNSGAYNNFTYDTLDYLSGSGISGYTSYSAFKDLTSMFTSNNWVDGNYTVADVPVHEGQVSVLGTYGAWNLVVIYEDLITSTEKYRSFSIFDGWQVVKGDAANHDVPVDISGFYTPDRTNLNASVSVFAAEGDKYIEGDHLITKNYNTNTDAYLPAGSSKTQTFNSSISSSVKRKPELTNNNGIDIQTFDIGSLLKPKQTNMEFHFTTVTEGYSKDTYWPSVLAFNTEIYEPKICYDYSYRQNNVELDVTSDLGHKPNLDTYLQNGPVQVGIYFRNKESDLKIEKLSFSTNIDSNVSSHLFYDTNSTYLSSINGSVLEGPINEVAKSLCDYNSSSTSTKLCTNDGNIRLGLGRLATSYSENGAGSVGSNEYQFFQFDLANNLSGKQNIDLNMSIDYYIVPKNGTPIPRKGRFLGEEIKICSENTAYNPIWGIFNVAERGSNFYNLKTQVAKKPFDVDLQFFEKDAVTGKFTVDTPSKDINTTVKVEIFDVEPFHDVQAACANPTAHTSTPLYVNVTLTENGGNHIQIPTQSPDYYNFAIKDAAYRVWHFNDQNGSLIENFDANATASNGLYDPAIHKDCIVKCSGAETSSTCIQCIESKYATPVCSRDNFSIRPEALDIRINDINQTTKDTDSKSDINAKLDYAPDSGAVPTERMRLATGYTLMYDINATNHQSLEATPWYVRTLDINNTWAPTNPVVCNDTSNYLQEVNFNSNGQVKNKEHIQNQVGQYTESIRDTSWTDVDVSKSHHIAPYFDMSANSDCAQNTSDTNGTTMGCDVDSSHVNNNTGDIYRNIYITFKPYKFIIPTFANNTFKYVANVEDNASNIMAIQYNGTIQAQGRDGIIPSNYVGGCYADDINISMNGNMELLDTSYRARFIDYNSSHTAQADFTRDINNSLNSNFDDLNLSSQFFRRDNSGEMDINVSMNYERNISLPQDPLIVQFRRVDVNCAVATDCQINADLVNDYNVTGSNDFVDVNITHYYGRLHEPDYRYNSLEGNATVYYEVYSDQNKSTRSSYGINGNESVDSINWYVNTLHDSAAYGEATLVPVTGVIPDPTQSIDMTNGKETISMLAPFVPYKDKIILTPNTWLVFNAFNSTATTDDFLVKFYEAGEHWAGEGKLGQTVDLNVSTKQNKRLNW